MKLVITHFFNEEHILPFWLKHHREIFDHGILIDYHSTDRSVEICKELVPSWEVVTSENFSFEAVMCDFEVMKHEQRFSEHWKLALNVTEFLVGRHLESVINWLEANDRLGTFLPTAIMVDDKTGEKLDDNLPLVEQKTLGVWEDEFPHEELKLSWKPRATRNRLLHRYAIGAYKPGRHKTNLPARLIARTDKANAAIFWYAYSPWNENFVRRKLQIQDQIKAFDRKHGFGKHHHADLEELEQRRNVFLEYAKDLSEWL